MFDDIYKEDDTFISSFLFYEGVRLLFIETQATYSDRDGRHTKQLRSLSKTYRRNVIHHV